MKAGVKRWAWRKFFIWRKLFIWRKCFNLYGKRIERELMELKSKMEEVEEQKVGDG